MADQLVLPFEEWRQIVDWPDYEISSLGRVRRLTPCFIKNPKNGREYVKYPIGHEMAAFDRGNGYLHVGLSGREGRKPVPIHVLICKTFNGPPPSPTHEVAHEDGNPLNNSPNNLSWKTHKENAEDMVRHGRSSRGTRSPAHKISESDVLEIRRLSAIGFPRRELARRFGVSESSIKKIRAGINWAWLNG
jgi:hypothetical protein